MFGEKLKARREEKGLSQDDVADFFGENFSRQAVSKWERDGGYPEVETLLVLAAKLDISLDALFEDELDYLKKKQPDEFLKNIRAYLLDFKHLSTTWKNYNCGGYPMEEKRNVFSDEVAIKIVDSVKEIILELMKRTLPANPQIEQK